MNRSILRILKNLGSLALLAPLTLAGLSPSDATAQTAGAERAPLTPEQRAEAERLSDDLEKLAKRQVWSGVEKKYKELVATGAAVELQDHLYGAYAARELGDVESAYERLQAAAHQGGSKEIVDWLWDIDHNYGTVSLSMVPPRSCELGVSEMPLDPNQRKAVEAAMRAAHSDCKYEGMLPRGDYQFAGMEFKVEPGFAVKVEVNPKVRKNGPVDPVIRWPNVPGSPGGPPATAPASAPASGGAGDGAGGGDAPQGG